MKIEVEFDEETVRALGDLRDFLGLAPSVTHLEILKAADRRLYQLAAERDEAGEEAAGEERRADRAEELLLEAMPIIHESHGGQPSIRDLSLCPHPECTRFHS